MAETQKVNARGIEPTTVDELTVFSNPEQKNDVSLLGGLVRIQYWESIMQDTVRATVVFTDTGNAIDFKSAVDGLPIVGQEKVALSFKDHQDNELIFRDDTALYVNKVTPITDDTTNLGRDPDGDEDGCYIGAYYPKVNITITDG